MEEHLEDTGDPFVVVDGDWRVTYVQGAALAALDLTPPDVLGTVLWDALPMLRGTPVESACRRAMESRQAVRFELAGPVSQRWYECLAFPAGDGIVVIGHDVTAEREAVEALRATERALREVDRRKDEFLATVAHELRNPLAPLTTALAVLRGEETGRPPAPEAARSALAVMDRQLRQLVRLVDDLLDVSRISRGRIQLRRERLDVASVMADAVEQSRPHLEGRRHALALELPPDELAVEGDPVRLRQVLVNLLNNAARYTEPGGHIRLSGWREGGEAVICVEDDGVGISAEALPHVFEPFTPTAEMSEAVFEGLGLGLPLVRGLVALHGGRVEARSAGPGQGSAFTVRIPAAPDEAPAAPEVAPPASAAADEQPALRVLVADDNVDAADTLVMLLELGGHDVRVAHDGPSALAEAQRFQPDVALLDIGMPGMTGYEVARHIRATPALSHVLLVAQTGWGQEEDRRRAREAGFDHHLVKPVELSELERVLASVADRRQS